jgi:hypothetical protein
MKIKSTLLAFMLVALIPGCNRSAPPKSVLAELGQKQRGDHMSIGWVDGQKLELIVFGAKPSIKHYTLSAEEAKKLTDESRDREKPPQIEGGSDAQRSPDGKWVTYRTPENKFVLADPPAG